MNLGVSATKVLFRNWRRKALLYKIFDAISKDATLFKSARLAGGRIRNFQLIERQGAIVEMAHMLEKGEVTICGKNLIELGTGWHPYLAALFYGMGASKIIMIDILSNIEQDAVSKTISFLKEHIREMAQIIKIPEEQLRHRFNELDPESNPWRDLWRSKGISYHAPFDFTDTGWNSESVDMIYSNCCLGYIPTPVLVRIFAECSRLLRPGGSIVHNVHIYDDYSNSDPNILPINFLTFSDQEWNRIGNSRFHYQNRLRPADYLAICSDAGLTPTYVERTQLVLDPRRLERSSLAEEFRDLPEEELLCAHLLLVAQKQKAEIHPA
jgi:SAM-dependent methyltransferase